MPDSLKIIDALKELNRRNTLPMHMPGHKRNMDFAEYLRLLGAEYDVTELDGFDDLHDACGLLKTAMERTSRLWKSKRSFFLVNGGTCGILAAVRAAARGGGKVIVARNCHRSVYNALELCGLDPFFVTPQFDSSFGICTSLLPEAVSDALDRNLDSRLVILTSPTYEGVISDVAGICKAAHERGVPVLVDEAHGAHLGFSEYFGGGAVKSGADIVVQSLHKTLPSLTQTAILHLNGDLIKEEEVERELSVFETSSPSYQLMASIDCCAELIETKGRELFTSWEENLKLFDEKTTGLKKLNILMHGSGRRAVHDGIFGFDRSKIVIGVLNTSVKGPELMMKLRRDYNIELEMAGLNYALAMTGLGDRRENLKRLADALLEIDRGLKYAPSGIGAVQAPVIPEKACSVLSAGKREKTLVDIKSSAGRISAEYIWAYPPGVPMLIPGERLSPDFPQKIKELKDSGIKIRSTYRSAPDNIFVLK